MTDPAVRAATAADHAAVVRVLAAAFHDDPLMRWVFPRERHRAQALRRLFTMEADAFLKSGIILIAHDGAAAATWLPPAAKDALPATAVLRSLPAWLRAAGPGRALRAVQAFALSERRRPKTPHYYLGSIGVDPPQQGRGRGAALIEGMTPRIDAEHQPAYLVSSNPRNLPLYERHGFQVTDELALPGGCPPLWTMWRDPIG